MKKFLAVLAFAGLSMSGFAQDAPYRSTALQQTHSGAIGLSRQVPTGMRGIQVRNMVRILQQVLSRSSVLMQALL